MKKALFLIVALVLALGLALPMAGTVGANPATLHVSKWTEDVANPVFDPAAKAYYPTVVKISDSDYRMWYGSDSGVGYATSADGLTWTEVKNPVGNLTNANHPLVKYVDGQFRIWYWDTGASIYGIDALRYAESSDGENWTCDQALTQDDTYKLITGAGTGWNRGTYGPGDVIYNASGSDTPDDANIWNNKYVFYYMATNGSNEYIGLAYSVDGKHWKRYGDDPVLRPCTEADDPSVGWDYRSVGYLTLMKDAHGIWHMWFSGGPNTNHGIGYAWSTDGINWTKVSDPIFHKQDGVTWRADRTYTPRVIQDGPKYKMWFSGKDTSGNYCIGYATADGPFPSIQSAIDAASPGDTINVAAGTYDETVILKSTTAPDISLIGENRATTFITGGICFATDYSGLKVQNFTIAGNGYLNTETYEATVSCKWPTHYAVTNLEFSDCVFDGEGYDDGKNGRCGVVIKRLGGVVKFENSEFKNYRGWATLDVNDGSGGGPLTVTSYTLNDNNVHDNWGSCALRGDPSDRTDTVTVTGNTFDSNGSETADSWAALEINEADSVTVSNNTITNTQAGSWGEGQALQLWKVGTVNIYENVIEGNFQGIAILNWPSGANYDISGISIYNNSFSDNDQYALFAEDGLTNGPVDAENNWWGSPTGPCRELPNGKWVGKGDKVSSDVDYIPWLPHPTKF